MADDIVKSLDPYGNQSEMRQLIVDGSASYVLTNIKIANNQKYTFSIWVKSDREITLGVKLFGNESNLTLGTSWTKFIAKIEVTELDSNPNIIFDIPSSATIQLYEACLVDGDVETSWTEAPEDKVSEITTLYILCEDVPSKPEEIITSTSTDAGIWTTVVPNPSGKQNNNYKYYTCEQVVRYDIVEWSDVVLLSDANTILEWCKTGSGGHTYIDGGKIYANSITSEQLATNSLKSNNYDEGISGTFFNLKDGSITSKNFKLDANGNITMKGNITAESGLIGGWIINNKLLKSSNSATYGNSGVVLDPSNGISLGSAFKVDTSGSLTANAGSIGGWNISNGALTSTNITISPTNGITIGSTFNVTAKGALTATSGTIGGWKINVNGFHSLDDKIHLSLTNEDVININGKFKIDKSGNIFATSGSIGDWTISETYGLISPYEKFILNPSKNIMRIYGDIGYCRLRDDGMLFCDIDSSGSNYSELDKAEFDFNEGRLKSGNSYIYNYTCIDGNGIRLEDTIISKDTISTSMINANDYLCTASSALLSYYAGGGFLTNSGKEMYFSVPLGQPYNGTVSSLSFEINIRCDGKYLVCGSDGTSKITMKLGSNTAYTASGSTIVRYTYTITSNIYNGVLFVKIACASNTGGTNNSAIGVYITNLTCKFS